jgi:dCMP deaminase
MTNLSTNQEQSTELTINPNRIELDEAYMQMAEIWAKRSKANRSQVGALIVKDKQIISDGYNGMPSGVEDDVCEYVEYKVPPYSAGKHLGEDDMIKELRTKPEVLHAESNALLKISENGGIGAQGATLYTTLSPCTECAKLIKQAKIKRVVYRQAYRITDGIEMLKKFGIEVDQLT